jgi:hypothetical protein
MVYILTEKYLHINGLTLKVPQRSAPVKNLSDPNIVILLSEYRLQATLVVFISSAFITTATQQNVANLPPFISPTVKATHLVVENDGVPRRDVIAMPEPLQVDVVRRPLPHVQYPVPHGDGFRIPRRNRRSEPQEAVVVSDVVRAHFRRANVVEMWRHDRTHHRSGPQRRFRFVLLLRTGEDPRYPLDVGGGEEFAGHRHVAQLVLQVRRKVQIQIGRVWRLVQDVLDALVGQEFEEAVVQLLQLDFHWRNCAIIATNPLDNLQQ